MTVLDFVLALLAALVLAGLALVAFTLYVARRVERVLPPEGRFIDIGADRLHYVDRGSGPALVFVHGLGGQWRNFGYLDFERLTRSHRVILVERPGSGHSVRGAGSPANIYAQARTIAQFIEALGLERPTLVGHSLGGAIALAVGLNHPRASGRLALIAPLSHLESAPPAPFAGLVLTSARVRRLVSLTLAVPMSIVRGPRLAALVFAPEPVPKSFALKGGGLLGLRPSSFYATSSDLVAAHEDLPDMERRYASLAVPVDVLYGRGDRVLDWRRHGEALAQKLARATLRVVEGGHMLPVTAPDATTTWLLEVATS